MQEKHLKISSAKFRPFWTGTISILSSKVFYDDHYCSDMWKHQRSWWCHQMDTFPRYWPFVRGIHRSPVNSPHKGQWPGALRFSLICDWINSWVNNREAGDLICHRAHYDVIVMSYEGPVKRRAFPCRDVIISMWIMSCVYNGIKAPWSCGNCSTCHTMSQLLARQMWFSFVSFLWSLVI